MFNQMGARFLCFVLLFAACGSEAGPPEDSAQEAAAPKLSEELLRGDLIFVSIDTLRADHLPFYGYERETAGDVQREHSLAWLAEQGTVYESVWAPIGKTMPSLASFWTGRFPLDHGAISNPTILDSPTFVDSLQQAGYATHAAVANRALSPGIGIESGFDSYAVLPKAQEPSIPRELLAQCRASILADSPVMLWAHFMAPHQPYTPASAFADRFTDRPDTPADNEALYALHADPSSLSPEMHAALVGLYDAEILTAATYVGELLAGLDAAYKEAGRGGLLDAATVVFFSDHGEELAERHGYFLHAKSLYRGVLHVPLVIAGRGFEPGRDNQPRGLGDVLPELLAGVEPKREVWAASWQTQFYALRDERWTLVHNPDGNAMGPYEKPEQVAYPYEQIELYDRDSDPYELKNIAAKHPAQVERLLAKMHSWYQSMPQRKPQFLPGTDPQALQKRMLELGYVDHVPDAVVEPWTVEQWKAHSSN